MQMLGRIPETVFIGQAVEFGGTGLYDTLLSVPAHKKYEFPVAENLQMGVCIGMALKGFIPISLYPRWNFLLSATDQIVNHLDKLHSMSSGTLNPRVIIRVAVGSEKPIDPQDQHKGNFSNAFRLMCKNIDILECTEPRLIVPAYDFAVNHSNKSCIIVEFPDYGK